MMQETSPQSDHRTLNISENIRVRLPLMLLVCVLSAVASGTFIWASQLAATDRQIERSAAHTVQLSDHETRLKELERASAAVEVIKADIRWIREELQRQRRETTGK